MSKKVRHFQQDTDNSKKRQRFCKAIADKEIGCDCGSSMPILLENIMDEIVDRGGRVCLDN